MKRLKFIFFVIFFLFGILIFRITYLTFFNKKDKTSSYSKKIKRGKIYDRQGIELAYSKDSHTVGIDTRNIYDIAFTAQKLSDYLQMDFEKIEEMIRTKKGYFLLKREINNDVAKQIQKMRLPGVRLERELKRVYPQKNLASNLIGFSGLDDNQALAGIEYYYKDYLLKHNFQTGAGDDLYLTIDSQIQKSVQKIIAEAFIESSSKKAIGILMKIDDSQIITMVNFPNFDPNQYFDFEQISKTNWAIRHLYEPGSTMKIFLYTILLNEGVVKLKERFFCPGFVKTGNTKIRCTAKHGEITLEQAFLYSCNSVTIKATSRLSNQKIYEYLKNFGFGQKTGILPNEKKGYLPPLKKWVASTPAFLSIGYGLSVTPIQLLKALNILLNQGKLFIPHVVMHTKDPFTDQINYDFFDASSINLSLKTKTVDKMKNLMRKVITKGTGNLANSTFYQLAGKTGTAQKFAPNIGYRDSGLFSSSFLGFYPFEKPEYLSLILFDEPNEQYQAAKLAAPVFMNIAETVLSETQETQLIPNYKLKKIRLTVPNIKDTKKIPKLVGMSKRKVLNILNQYSNEFKIYGHGFSYKQEPPSNKKNNNQIIKVYFR